jgi:predicted transcriptional regulator
MMLSIVQQLEAARPHFVVEKPVIVKNGNQVGRIHRELIYKFLPKTNGVSSREIEEKFGISRACACQNLNELRVDGLAARVGKVGKFMQWIRL